MEVPQVKSSRYHFCCTAKVEVLSVVVVGWGGGERERKGEEGDGKLSSTR